MERNWTFGEKIGAGFAITVAITVAMGVVAVYALKNVVQAKDHVITVTDENIIEAEKMTLAQARQAAALRGFLLDQNDRHVDEITRRRDEFRASLQRLRTRAVEASEITMLDQMDSAETEYNLASDRVLAMRKTAVPLDAVIKVFDAELVPRREALVKVTDEFIALEERLRGATKNASAAAAASSINLLLLMAGVAVALATLVAFLLTRTLGRQIGTAVGQVQSSSAELQSAASQQATGAKQQSTAMNEINTTISELLATSRQIAESARRVAQIADQTATAARSGHGTVEKAQEAMAGIRRQMDLVVSHMLELGKKSQQIGAVLDIVSELAEQTNILAINATIEAAGAGESGKRFAIVADEIRKLADRVAGSTKEIRTLIDDVRSAVNTTVMATETGSKTVDAGSRHFADVATAFKQIAGLVSTTTEAAREIELSTKQQTSAVEQVNLAIANVAQATKETEASSSQTLQTASQLAGLSLDLQRLVEPRLAA